MSKQGVLYLIPVSLGDCDLESIMPIHNFTIIHKLNYFIAENAKEARAFLKQTKYQEIGRADIQIVNQHTKTEALNEYLLPITNGHNMGLMSDAGCPGIADPGAEIIKQAHQKKIKVAPLVGPSSIVLSIMASGFNGQNFAFVGYLPINKIERNKRIKALEQIAVKQKQAQFFIETPYRNLSLFEDLLKTLNQNSLLLIATNLTLQNESIIVKTIKDWQKTEAPSFVKQPTVFGLYI
ncbi:MAG: SAM-dependent methyltransferase [Bacteroidota bacterium]|jgi:16S rRNA (cytidine1402-2'-O)-methyltransferase